ncbi:MAG: CBS domain-containing protein [Ignavibacteria bacterium]|nr:CBS domain-containing protein [Ignavibacteria bacterium]MBT8391264.1 CBS domain-containing protein [Ignavibacteria bacterium]NNL21685.1 CBS domain-containing protein [Ignavibacteriaceae bacterium]
MEKLTVKEMMVPLSRYATVSEDATLGEAVKTLKQAQKDFDHTRDKHRAILITDRNNNIVGKLSQLDVIKALEPKYVKLDDRKQLSRFGFSKDYMKAILKEHQLWDKSMDRICEKASTVIVKTIMYTPTDGEYVKEDTTLEEAIHQLIMGRHQSLLVTHNKGIVGILRLTDVFREIANRISACSENKK